ncbi:uncharacterized protein TRUGW13939_08632 [Talaromyces rugulosus]|uniref:Uncharacterized protein n=1 Tax=Talaromyces rugulosus TaxID=121627 RepID=A0A7H8R6V8_TALRU|nr:uncharacterized protein TRUGW13939_08632 [Talaromyces rugulosus]QKX61481.1 hypothetical protein TRUGW13939_08632 [Talaromyces rugulosus]
MKVSSVISLIGLGAFAMADPATTSADSAITNAAEFLSAFGITASLPGAKATSLAQALYSLNEAQMTRSEANALAEAFATAVPSSLQDSIGEGGYTFQLDASTTSEPSWFTYLPDSAQSELLLQESQILSVENEYLATTTSSGVASQQTIAAAGGVLAAGFVGVVALL